MSLAVCKVAACYSQSTPLSDWPRAPGFSTPASSARARSRQLGRSAPGTSRLNASLRRDLSQTEIDDAPASSKRSRANTNTRGGKTIGRRGRGRGGRGSTTQPDNKPANEASSEASSSAADEVDDADEVEEVIPATQGPGLEAARPQRQRRRPVRVDD